MFGQNMRNATAKISLLVDAVMSRGVKLTVDLGDGPIANLIGEAGILSIHVWVPKEHE